MSRLIQLVLLSCVFAVATAQAAAGPTAAVDSETTSLLLASLGALGLAVAGEPRRRSR
ncbi:MAG: hypothetical protein JRG83_14410 [Deltaproteobacteria bacterium]|nr:hypothetical protein [Deltaproteobacteria bacterium]